MNEIKRSQKFDPNTGKPIEGAYYFGNYDDTPLPPFSMSQATFYKNYEGEKAHYHTIVDKVYMTLKGLGILVVNGVEKEMRPEVAIHVQPGEIHYVKEVLEEPLEFIAITSKKINDKVIVD